MANLLITYQRVIHAAHTGRQLGWDLEIWDVEQPFDAPKPEGVPRDAERSIGAFTAGVQVTRFVRKAPLSDGFCEFCAPRARALSF